MEYVNEHSEVISVVSDDRSKTPIDMNRKKSHEAVIWTKRSSEPQAVAAQTSKADTSPNTPRPKAELKHRTTEIHLAMYEMNDDGSQVHSDVFSSPDIKREEDLLARYGPPKKLPPKLAPIEHRPVPPPPEQGELKSRTELVASTPAQPLAASALMGVRSQPITEARPKRGQSDLHSSREMSVTSIHDVVEASLPRVSTEPQPVVSSPHSHDSVESQSLESIRSVSQSAESLRTKNRSEQLPDQAILTQQLVTATNTKTTEQYKPSPAVVKDNTHTAVVRDDGSQNNPSSARNNSRNNSLTVENENSDSEDSYSDCTDFSDTDKESDARDDPIMRNAGLL